ncbi:EutN/CcmL family microcompartment protein [Paenibacillus tianjinensis]|uniref:EutN/CcmL family microcompartment protein n=1 Tax=Paenibacillus tianjinensis TaxID=2810347 RepID=A0ABX7L858_9BACL|nr:EutN/CcmL family microcompartment protein [Paenibacillus tianjinensis]
MILGRVVGNVVSTMKKKELDKYKLFLIESLHPKLGKNREVFVALDLVGAGIGDCVLVVKGSQAQHVFQEKTPADAAIVGIVDTVNTIDPKIF